MGCEEGRRGEGSGLSIGGGGEETAGRDGGVWVWGQAAVELRLVKARTGPLVSLSLADALAAAAHLSLFSFPGGTTYYWTLRNKYI